MKFIKQNLGRIFLTVLTVLLLDRLVVFALGQVAINKESNFKHYLENLSPMRGTGKFVGTISHDCNRYDLAKIYYYKICGKHVRRSTETGQMQFVLIVQKPAPFFSIISKEYPDRLLWDGVNILLYSLTGEEILRL